jgi:hypothetical protein
MKKRTYTIAEAAELTGLTRKALARRVERGSLQSLVRGGRRMIPHAELVRAGLISDGDSGDRPAAAGAPASDGGEDLAGTDLSLVASLMRELMDRLERQAGEIAQFRALTVQAESLRLEKEMTELRARLASLEGRPPDEATAAPPARQWADAPTVVASANDQLWLPPSAEPQPAHARPAPRPMPPPVQPQAHWQEPARSTGVWRVIGFILEALFIVGVAVCAWRLELRPGVTVALVATAWLLVAGLEWLRWATRRS